jgi:hypothetical protein
MRVFIVSIVASEKKKVNRKGPEIFPTLFVRERERRPYRITRLVNKILTIKKNEENPN